MKVINSKKRGTTVPDARIAEILDGVSRERLRGFVEMFAFPRHFFSEHAANQRARDMLIELALDFGYEPSLQGEYDNVVLTSSSLSDGPFLLLGAHYDTAPRTPGADDNGSAMAVCLECARLLRRHGVGGVMIVFFNREEDGFLGSAEFVAHLAEQTTFEIQEAHIFEMVGYRDALPGSQKMPSGLPAFLVPNTGDFLALLSNSGSNTMADDLVNLAASYVSSTPVLALQMYMGLEKSFRDLNRSDHTPFWQAGIPAIMWTDTSEFRNPHYHGASDKPDTLDYGFMAEVARLALARATSERES